MAAPDLIVELDRNSVCMGDDAESHQITMIISPNDTLQTVIDAIIGRKYLAEIAGGKATWIAAIGNQMHHRPVAVVAQQWPQPRFIADPHRSIAEYLKSEGAKGIFFKYCGQSDPEKALGIGGED